MKCLSDCLFERLRFESNDFNLIEMLPCDDNDVMSFEAELESEVGRGLRVNESNVPGDPAAGVDFGDSAHIAQDRRRGSTAPQASEEAAPAVLSSPHMLTGGAISNPAPDALFETPGNFQFLGGFDGGSEETFKGVWFDGDTFERECFYSELTEIKRRAKKALKNSNALPLYCNIGGRKWLMHPKGVTSKGSPVVYRYYLTSNGVSLLINALQTDSQPDVKIVYGYESLVHSDLETEHNKIVTCLATAGFVITQEKLGRVDLQITANVNFDEFAAAFRSGRVVTRVRKPAFYTENSAGGLRLTSFRGGCDLQVAIYDKMLECLEKKNEKKLDDLSSIIDERRQLTRVEFRFRRPALKRFGLETVQDFVDHLPAIIEYLTVKWFRVLSSDKVRGRENKQACSDVWKHYQDAFQEVFCKGLLSDQRLTVRQYKTIDTRALVLQGLGCLSTELAIMENELTEDEFRQELIDAIDKRFRLMYRQYKIKRARHYVFETDNVESCLDDIKSQFKEDERLNYDVPF